MPYLKFIKGHTSPTYVQDYLEKGGRALEKDFVNVSEWPNSTWGQEMDAFRAAYAKRTGNRTGELTYLHYVLSPDPSDNVTLEELQEFTLEFLERAFEDKFQIAVVYHDDSAMRLANGEKGILHAHFVVNSLNCASKWRRSVDGTTSSIRIPRTQANQRMTARAVLPVTRRGKPSRAWRWRKGMMHASPT